VNQCRCTNQVDRILNLQGGRLVGTTWSSRTRRKRGRTIEPLLNKGKSKVGMKKKQKGIAEGKTKEEEKKALKKKNG